MESLTNEKTKTIPGMKAICLAELGRHEESISILKVLLNEYPDDKLILTNLRNIYLIMKDYRTAEKHIKKLISMDNSFSPAHFFLGKLYSHIHRIDDSIVEIEKAISLIKHPLKRKKWNNY